MRLFRPSITACLLLVATGLSACLTGGGSSGVGAPSGAAGGSFSSPGATPYAPSPLAASAGGETMPPRSALDDGLGGGDVEFIAFRVFLSPKTENTQEPSEKIPDAIEAKDVLNLKLTVQGGLKAFNPDTDEWSEIGWMTFGIGPYLRIVKMPKFSPASVSVVLYQDQMGLSVALGDVSYNGIINDLPVAEGDVVSIYLFYQEDPKGTSAETFFVKPTNYSETLTAFPEGGLASFAADPKTHLLASFAVKPPAAASSGEPPAPSGIRVQRPDGLRDFSNYLVK